MPYGISEQTPLEKFQIPNALVTDFGAELVVDRVTEIDQKQKRVVTAFGSVYEYRHLVLATGSRPLIPPIPGVEGKNITPVRSLEDLSSLRHLAATGKRAVVVGGGYIGIEVAVVLRQLGLEVTVVEMLPSILMATTEPEFIAIVNDELEAKGINLLTGGKVVELTHLPGGEVTVKLESGTSLPADFVVLSVGVIPNTNLAEEAGVQCSRLGIGVNEHLRTGADDVYACGDCAEKVSFITGQPTRGEFGTNAVFMAKTVARNILSLQGRMPWLSCGPNLAQSKGFLSSVHWRKTLFELA